MYIIYIYIDFVRLIIIRNPDFCFLIAVMMSERWKARIVAVIVDAVNSVVYPFGGDK